MLKPMPLTWMVSVVVLGLGCLVGMFGSYTTVRKYLKIWWRK
jgi:cell division protein FtsX